MIVADRGIQGRGEKNYLIPRHPRLRPILHRPFPSQNNHPPLALIAAANHNRDYSWPRVQGAQCAIPTQSASESKFFSRPRLRSVGMDHE